jgi:hypothetical protein
MPLFSVTGSIAIGIAYLAPVALISELLETFLV